MPYEVLGHDLGHLLDDFERESLEEGPGRWINLLVSNPPYAYNAVLVLKDSPRYATILDPRVAYIETWESWVVAMQAYYAMFRIQAEEWGSEVQIRLRHDTYTVKAARGSSDLNAKNWLDAFFLAVICRNEKMLEYLCSIPAEVIRQRGESEGAEYAPHMYHWVSALQAVIMHREEFDAELASALEKSDPERSGFGDDESVGKLVFPQMLVLLRLVERDSAAFNEALAAGVAAFGEYWTATESRANNVNGVFPLGLLAFACMAYDIAQVDPEFELDVVSGYLPKHLVEHSWFDEFPICSHPVGARCAGGTVVPPLPSTGVRGR